MRYILLIICLLYTLPQTIAQGLEFETTNWNFANIEEMGGDVTCRFKFKNSSPSPVVIHSVKTSCGCTTPEYSRRPIAAGAESYIEVAFDPRYRPGKFMKDIYVYSTASAEPTVLTVEGYVNGRTLSVEERYPYTLGKGGRIGALYVTVAGIERGELVQSQVEYTNSSDFAMEVEFRARRKRDELKLFYDAPLAAGEQATVEVGYFYDHKLPNSRFINDTIDIYVNGSKSDKSLFIKGMILD